MLRACAAARALTCHPPVCQGTRSASGQMAEFKKGAFTVAAKENVPVIPITLDGTGRLMRNGARRLLSRRLVPSPPLALPCAGQEHSLFPGKVVITVHPPIQPGDADKMCVAAQLAVQSALPKALHYDPTA